MYSFWDKALEYLRDDLLPVSFQAFIEPLQLHHLDEDAGVVYLAWPNNAGLIKHIKDRYLDTIQTAVGRESGRTWRIVIKPEKEYRQENTQSTSGIIKNDTDLKLEKLFNPRFNFESFVVGKCNQFAHAVSLAVAETPGEAYNPLFIYGGSGLGKTHLMQAIGIHIIRKDPSKKVLYVSSEMFTNELITSINEKKTRAFRNKYRKLDVLLIDDIQFLEGKEATQQEFFHTFESLYQNNGQIVITSDRPPAELEGLDERLVTRFGGNMVADVQRPDYETRVAILESFAGKKGIEVTPDVYEVLCLIAEKLTDNVRELEGAFNRVVAFSQLMNEEINAETAKGILKDIIKNDDRAMLPEKIRIETARYYKVRTADMDSKKRSADITLPRMVAMYLIRENTDVSLGDIGKLFGGRNHATVIHAIEKMQKEISDNSQLQDAAEAIMKKVKG